MARVGAPLKVQKEQSFFIFQRNTIVQNYSNFHHQIHHKTLLFPNSKQEKNILKKMIFSRKKSHKAEKGVLGSPNALCFQLFKRELEN